jgi:hypothetical protein
VRDQPHDALRHGREHYVRDGRPLDIGVGRQYGEVGLRKCGMKSNWKGGGKAGGDLYFLYLASYLSHSHPHPQRTHHLTNHH